MRNVVKLQIKGGTLLMPARTPYEEEIVLENAALYAGRYGSAELELSAPRRLVQVMRATPTTRCATCGRLERYVAFKVAGVSRCRRCIRVLMTWPYAGSRLRPFSSMAEPAS